MEKYQKALGVLFDNALGVIEPTTTSLELLKMFNANITKEKNILQELVDKAIPYKPTDIISPHGNTNIGDCKCGTSVFGSWDYCPYCSQALDWTGDKVNGTN